MAKMTNENNKWILNQTISVAGTSKKTFETAGSFVDKNIEVNTTVNQGAYNISKTNDGVITPSVSITSGSTYGFTSGTLTGTYLTIDPEATVKTNWQASSSVTTAGFLGTQTKTQSGTPTIENGQNYYVPVVTPTLSGGGLTVQTHTNVLTTTPEITVEEVGTFKTASGYGFTTTKPSGTDGTNYLTIDGKGTVTTSGKATSTLNVTSAPITYSNNAGVISAHSNENSNYAGLSTGTQTKAIDIIPTITDNFESYYVPIVDISFTGGGVTGSTTTSISTNMSNTTSSPYYIDATATGSAKANTVFYSNDPGVITSHGGATAMSQSSPLNIGSSAQRYYVPEATFNITGGGLTNATNFAYTPTVNIASGAANTSSLIAGSFTLGSQNTSTYPYYIQINSTSSSTSGNTKVEMSAVTQTRGAGYTSGGTFTLVASGSSSPTATVNQGSKSTYLNIKGASVAPSYTANNILTYFDNGTSSDTGINITPNYTNTVGYIEAHSSAQNGSTTYYKIKTTSVLQGTSSINNGALTRGTASWGTGWITGGNITGAILANSGTSGISYLDISNTTGAPVLVSNDYLYINKGYIDNVKISLAKLVPDNASADLASSHILSGYSAYNSSGQLIAGNIQTKAISDINNNGQTYTIPAGYYPNSGTITVPAATIKSGSGKITSVTYTYDSTNTRFNIAGSTNISAPTVSTAGYVSSSVGTKQTNDGGATVETTVPRIAIKATMTASAGSVGTRTPSISRTSTSATGATNVGSAAATTTAPASGYFVSVQSASDKYSITATPSVTTAGYGTTSQYGSTNAGPTTVGIEQSAVTYIPLDAASATNSATASAAINSISVSYNSSAGNFSVTGNKDITGTATLTVSQAGWLPKNNITGSFTSAGGATLSSTLNKIAIKAEMTGTAKVTPSISRTGTTATGATNVGSNDATTTAPNSGYFVSVQSSASANNITATPSVTTAGYGTTSQYTASGSTLSVGANASLITYIPITAAQSSANSANVEVLTTDGSNAGVNIAGIVQTSSATTTEPTSGYYLYLRGKGSSKITTAGWIPTGALGEANSSKYFPVTVATVSGSGYNLNITNSNLTISPTVTLTRSEQNVSNYSVSGTRDSSNYPYYVKIHGASSTGSKTIEASTSDYKDVRTAGYLPARSETTVVAGKSTSATVSVSAGSADTYVQLKGSTITSSGSNIATYFNSGTSSDYNVAIYHTATAGYTPALTSGSTASYWKIKPGSISSSNGVITYSQGWVEDGSLNIGAGDYSATASQVIAGTVTPSVSISNASTYGFTSGTLTGTYVTIDPGASVTTNWKARATANITQTGFVTSGNSKTDDYEGTPSIAAGQNWYVPVQTPSVTGGGLSASISTNTISVTGMKTTTTNTGYAINATASGSASRAVVQLTIDPGVVKQYSASGAIAATSSNISKAASTVYIQSGNVSSITGGGITMAGTQTLTPAIAIASGATTSGPTLLTSDSYSLGAVNSGTYAYYFPIKATTTGTSSTTITATRAAASATKTEGYITSGTVTLASGSGSRTVSASNTTGTTTYLNIKKLTGSVTGTNTVTPTVSVSNNSNVTLSTTDNGIQITATGGGTASVNATSTATAAGYLVSGATIATATLSASSNTTSTSRYITAVTVPKDKTFSLTTTADTALDTTSNVTITNNAYRNLVVNNAANGTVTLGNSGTAAITNRGTATVTSFASGNGTLNVVAYSGSSALASQQIVTNGQWKVQTQTAGTSKTGPFYGVTYVNPMSSGTQAAVTVGANATATSPTVAKHSDTNVQSSAITTSKPGSGYYVAVQGTAPATTLTFTKAVGTAGYMGATSQITASGSVAAKTGSTYYVPITAGAATVGANATATSPTIAKHSDTNASAGTITTSKPSSGYYVAVQGTAPATTLTFTKAINTSGYVSAVSQITASGSVAAKTGSTYYVPLTNAAGSVTMTAGNGACGISSASGVTYASTNAYSNGVGVTFTGSGQVSATAKITTAGYTPTNNSFATGSATASNSATSTQYIKGITLNKPSSGWSHFDLTIPNGTSDMMTFCFHVDSNGNVVVDDQPGVVPS